MQGPERVGHHTQTLRGPPDGRRAWKHVRLPQRDSVSGARPGAWVSAAQTALAHRTSHICSPRSSPSLDPSLPCRLYPKQERRRRTQWSQAAVGPVWDRCELPDPKARVPSLCILQDGSSRAHHTHCRVPAGPDATERREPFPLLFAWPRRPHGARRVGLSAMRLSVRAVRRLHHATNCSHAAMQPEACRPVAPPEPPPRALRGPRNTESCAMYSTTCGIQARAAHAFQQA